MIQVIDGKIKQHQLPKVGKLSDGRTVSGYHLLGDYCNLPLYKDCETQEHAREKITLQNKIFDNVIEKVKSEFPYYTTEQSLTYEHISQNIDKIIEEQYGVV